MLFQDTLTGALHEVPDYLLRGPGLGEYDDGLGFPALLGAALPAIAGAAGSLLGGGGGGGQGGGGGGGAAPTPVPQFIPIPTPQLVPLPIPIPYPVVRVRVPVPMPMPMPMPTRGYTAISATGQALPYGTPASPYGTAPSRRRARRRR